MRHFLVEPERLAGDVVTIGGEDARHIATVLRLTAGATITVTCDGRRYDCRVTSTTADRVTADVVKEIVTPPDPTPPLTLLQGIPKGKKMDDIVRMVTEAGVATVIPLITRWTEVKLDGETLLNKTHRWRAVAHAADKQSGSLARTTVTEPVKLAEAGRIARSELKLVFWEEKAPSLKACLSLLPSPPASIALLIGPEGGLAADEVETLQGQGFLPVSLGPKILRTETAGLTAVAALRYHFM